MSAVVAELEAERAEILADIARTLDRRPFNEETRAARARELEVDRRWLATTEAALAEARATEGDSITFGQWIEELPPL